jgi:hypothetical protein
MQIGNEDLDRVCRDAIVPALSACGLDPKRVDKHNEGGLLKSEIIKFIEKADIVVADVTNERPNCYLEIGYTMGVDKFRNLILTARHDHNQDSPDHKPGGPKVHFDLQGYDVLFWTPSKIEDFRIELEKRIRRRQAIMIPAPVAGRSPWDDAWINEQRTAATAGLSKIERTGYMEVRFALAEPKTSKTQQELLAAARDAVIHTTGWPFALVLDRDEFKPRPKTFGVVADITGTLSPSLYDYWALKRNGDFYSLRSFWEDGRVEGKMGFNVRITQVCEVLLYCARLYERLGIENTGSVNIAIRHAGLKGRELVSAGGTRHLWGGRRTSEDVVEHEVSIPLAKIESDLVVIVKDFIRPLFTMFEFFELADNVFEDIVDGFVSGEVT